MQTDEKWVELLILNFLSILLYYVSGMLLKNFGLHGFTEHFASDENENNSVEGFTCRYIFLFVLHSSNFEINPESW